MGSRERYALPSRGAPLTEPVGGPELAPVLLRSTLDALAGRHLARYRGMLERGRAGDRSIRVHECEELIGVWEGVQNALKSGANLEQRGIDEICDALESGDFDEILPPSELDAVKGWRGDDDGPNDDDDDDDDDDDTDPGFEEDDELERTS